MDPVYIKSTSVKETTSNGLEIYFSGIGPGIYQALAMMYANPPSYYGNVDSYDWHIPGSLSYESGGVVADIVKSIGFITMGHTSYSGSETGYTTVSFPEKIPLLFTSSAHLILQLPSWAKFTGLEIGYLIKVA
jgi:hypothetical protein